MNRAGLQVGSGVLRQREAIYAECASLIVDTDGLTVDAIVERIVSQLPLASPEGSGP